MAGLASRGSAPPFLDTNVLLYLLSADASKADRAEALLASGATIGVQVLNEFAHVARRKLGMAWSEVEEVLGLIRQRCSVRPLKLAVHEQAMQLAQRHGFAWYDALIVSAALDAKAPVLYSEDMHDGLEVASPDGAASLMISNPFTAPLREARWSP
ncbi:MAG TPA: PIN domain-containing protein [Methylibium sp.]